ncbi:MAG: mucoidy inhibitor MuiA family protein [Cyanobacteria bacterium P01_G01_bin.67]
MKKNIEAAISAVTVYTNLALVIRKTTISLTGEEKEIILSQLPVTLLPESVRVTGKGTSPVSISGIRVKSIFTPEVSIARVAELEHQIKTLKTQKAALNNRSQSQKLQLNFVEQLSEKSQTHYALNLAKQQIDIAQAQELLDFMGDKYLEYSDHLSELGQQQQDIDNQITALEKQKQKLQISRNKEYLDLIVFIETAAAGEFELEIFYLVSRAGWTPLYDLQVNTSKKQLNLTYLAEVRQNTGEDWHNVPLTLSTAKPGLGTLPPKLEPWYINVDAPVAGSANLLAKAVNESVSSPQRRRRSSRASDNQLPAAEPPSIEAEVVAATASRMGSVVTFEVGNGGDIPSDNTPHKVNIFRDRFPINLEYVAMPRLVSFTYLQATVTNPATGVTLLPGKANILREQTFVGTSTLENVAPAQDFTLNLGIDEAWKIDRNLVQRQVDKKLIGSYKRITYAYRIVVDNLLATEASLKLTEQLPVSRDERIKVRLIQSEPKIKLGEMGVLEWMVTLTAGEQQTIDYQFTLEYPPEIKISGLDI